MNRKQNTTEWTRGKKKRGKRVGLRLPTRRQKKLLRKMGWMGDLNTFTRQEASWAIQEEMEMSDPDKLYTQKTANIFAWAFGLSIFVVPIICFLFYSIPELQAAATILYFLNSVFLFLVIIYFAYRVFRDITRKI